MLCMSVVAACGGPGTPPSASKHASIPAQAVNDTSIGVIRVRLGGGSADPKAGSEAIAAWMAQVGMDAAQAKDIVTQFRALGLETILAVIPGDERFAEDIGLYAGGDPRIKATDLEDVLIGTAGLAGAVLTVVDIGNGWFYVGANGDGTIEGASSADAAELAGLLDRIGERRFVAALSLRRAGFAMDRLRERGESAVREAARDAGAEELLREGGFVDGGPPSAEPEELRRLSKLLPSGNSRLLRRLRAFLDAAEDSEALCWTVTEAGESAIMLVFADDSGARAFLDAIAGIRRDIKLAIDGAERRGELSSAEAQDARQRVDAIDFRADGASVTMFETR